MTHTQQTYWDGVMFGLVIGSFFWCRCDVLHPRQFLKTLFWTVRVGSPPGVSHAVVPVRLGGTFSRKATANFHEHKSADVTLARPCVVIDRGRGAARPSHNGQNVVRLYPGDPDVEGRARECAAPLGRHLQVKSLVGVRQTKMASRSSAASAPLETVTGAAAAAGVVASGAVAVCIQHPVMVRIMPMVMPVSCFGWG